MKGPATTTVVERPPAGPARGPVPAPVWLVALLSASVALLAGYAVLRAWKRRLT